MTDRIFDHTDHDGDRFHVSPPEYGDPVIVTVTHSGTAQGVYLSDVEVRALRDALTAYLGDAPAKTTLGSVEIAVRPKIDLADLREQISKIEEALS